MIGKYILAFVCALWGFTIIWVNVGWPVAVGCYLLIASMHTLLKEAE